jgi:hypothetical protein
MMDERTDGDRQLLIALLFGELSPEEERRARDRLAADPALRREMAELEEMRSLLGEWDEVPDSAPKVIFVHQADRPAPSSNRDRSGNRPGFPGSLVHSGWRSVVAPAAWGLTGVAACLALFLLAGLRVQQTADGLLVGFSAGRNQYAALSSPDSPAVPGSGEEAGSSFASNSTSPSREGRSSTPAGEGHPPDPSAGAPHPADPGPLLARLADPAPVTVTPPDPGSPAASQVPRPAGGHPTGTSAGDPGSIPVTEARLQAELDLVGRAMVRYVDSYLQDRDQSVAQYLRLTLADADSRREADYQRLKADIEGLGAGLIQDQRVDRERLDYLWRQVADEQDEYQLGDPPRRRKE